MNRTRNYGMLCLDKRVLGRKQTLNRVLICFVVLCFPLLGFTQKFQQNISDSTLFEIYFSDGFDSDTITFMINDLTISEKMILKSNPYYGQCEAKVTAKYYSSDSILLLVNNGMNEALIRLKKEKKYNLKLISASEKKSFAFDQNKGKFLLIYRVPNKKLIFGQRISRPSFE